MNKNFEDKNILHVKNGEVEYIQFKILNKYSDKLKHLITLRYGGVISGDYKSLSFRLKDKNLRSDVFKNKDIISNILNISDNKVYKASQNHTDNILIINNENKEKYLFENICDEEFDGYICEDKNIATLVTVADCNPIIIYDKEKNIYANIHSGWKGTIKQIYLKAIKILLDKFGCEIKNLIVCIGPSINKCCFDSEDETFKQKFLEVWDFEEEYIYYEKENKKRFHIDLPYVIKKDSLKIGIKEENIVLSNICTHCNSQDFFSYRYYTKLKKKDYGTMAVIVENRI